jgi:hypothetical protein
MDDELNFRQPNRTTTHGQITEVSTLAQKLKDLLRSGQSWERMSPLHREMLEIAATKLARIVCGDPTTRDHWREAAWCLITASEHVTATQRAPERLYPRMGISGTSAAVGTAAVEQALTNEAG